MHSLKRRQNGWYHLYDNGRRIAHIIEGGDKNWHLFNLKWYLLNDTDFPSPDAALAAFEKITKSKDRRYATIQRLHAAGHIRRLSDIFHDIPKTVVGKDLGFNSDRMNRLLRQPHHWLLHDLFRLSTLIGISEREILELVMKERDEQKRT